ncbi:D-alanine--D-alanine ligase [Marininema halotolerans]|uniref:D-alanine--D-alanine ligase n=1 Tax=Marininema halotolerans TaxID=1155944 RepID=A0A1I6UCA3_9BACL|nr:D-alanine--D-alanine ligase [Marininema halotolerans]SFS99086.1 D-alanine-D-alanine ligase [Marininema halotolerans]
MNKKIRVAILYGGKSGEHDVSLFSAASVIQAIDPEKMEILPVWIDKEGHWRTGEQALLALEGKLEAKRLEDLRSTKPTLPKEIQGSSFPLIQWVEQVDVVFPVLHGTFGEDGTVQGLLEMANIPYVGAGVLASAVGMDKVVSKRIFANEGLPQGRFVQVHRHRVEKSMNDVIAELENSFAYPMFVKPANLGSSVGISKAKDRATLEKALHLAASYDRKLIVEEFIDAKEVEVAVLGNDEPEASIPGEIISSNEYYDYKAKYIDGKAVMKFPAELPEETLEEIRQLAIRAYQAIDASGLSRVDFFVTNNDQRVLINEINTMPGFTPHSMYANLWEHTGVSYKTLIEKLIELAMQRYEEKKKTSTKFEVE